MSKRVLHIFGTMNRGGAEMRTLSLMQAMRERSVQFDYCVLSGEKGVLDDRIRELGGRIYYCKLGPTFIFRFFKLLKSGQFAAVHSHVAYVSGFILFIALLARIKLRIAHFRNTTDGVKSTFLRRIRNAFLHKLISISSTHIIGVCIGALEGFWGKNWREDPKCQVIYNGFALPSIVHNSSFWRAYLPSYQGQRIIVNVARMDVQKNHLRQCVIFNELKKLNSDKDSFLVIIGKEDSGRKAVIERYLSEKNLTNSVFFLGLQNDVLPFLAHADIMLFPSLWEGLPGVVLEAASVGLPVLGSDLPGILEISNQLPNIHTLSLLKTDEEWAQQLAFIMAQKNDKENSASAFIRSDFLLNNNIEQLCAIYSA
jgi:glycosyltransferase involved in cell wall biosynthesis